MNRLNDCFALDDRPISVGAAEARLAERLRPLVGSSRVPLADALRRILAESVVSGIDVPGFDNAAVDGYAFAHGGVRYRLVGRAAAGRPFGKPLGPREAVRILTGAPIPTGADTVAMQEDAEPQPAGRPDSVVVPSDLPPGSNLRRAGENIRCGKTVLDAGQRLGPLEIGVAASLGLPELPVFDRLKVALFSTGDELVPPGGRLRSGRIHDSNRAMLAALLAECAVAVNDLGILPDRAGTVRTALGCAARDHHVVMTSAGVSAGDEDHVAHAVHELHFWRLAVKPGRPLALGRIGEAAFVGLPGNPVAAAACFAMIVRPMLGTLGGGRWETPRRYPVQVAFTLRKKPGRREWLRVRLDGDGLAHRAGADGSGLLKVMADADGLLDLPEDTTEVVPGEFHPMLPLK